MEPVVLCLLTKRGGGNDSLGTRLTHPPIAQYYWLHELGDRKPVDVPHCDQDIGVRPVKGIVHDRILRTRNYTHVSIDGPEKVDCAYLVTIGNSPYLPSQVTRLMRCARKVIVLYTTICRSAQDAQFRKVEFISFDGMLHDSILQRRSSLNPTLRWNRQFDIPSKRSFAIEHAKANGFSTVLLVDDDVLFRETFVPSALHLLRDGTDIACSYTLFHADVSTLDRLRCSVSGASPEVSIGGNAVILRVGPRLGLFPYIYNEDWLFLWSSIQYGSATVTPFQNVVQRPSRKGRESLAQMEQFGELIAFMLFYQEDRRDDLSLLQQPPYVDHCINTYRRAVSGMLKYDKHRKIIMDSLSALDDITTSDVCLFAEHFERELTEHYERITKA